MLHLGAFYQSIDPAGVLTAINAVQDASITVSGADVRVPLALPYLVGQAALLNDASGTRAQIQAPSLRAMANLDVEPLVLAATFGTPPESMIHGDNPIPLAGNESINFYVESNPAAAAAHYGLVWFGDGAIQPVKGNIYTVRATSAVQQVAGAWVNGNLTFSQVLPVGTYDIVGMRARSTDGVAARLVFVGAPWRPGVPMVNAVGDLDPYFARYGSMGIFGRFDSTTPPTVDVLGGVAAAQVFEFDLVRVK